MRSVRAYSVLTAAITSILIQPTIQLPSDSSSLTNFSNPVQSLSAGGKAKCISGVMSITVSATNTKILISPPANNFAVTEFYVESNQANSVLAKSAIGGPNQVSGTYSIYSKLCYPAGAAKPTTLQVLTHGGTLDHTYWDIAPGYSYVDSAAAAGYATFSYDRLGTGLSDHPDPAQVVQLPLQIEIAHAIVQRARNAEIGGFPFNRVVGVGHSLGSALTQGVAAKYPKDFDALILQGTSTTFTWTPIGVASTAQQLANTDPSGRFKGLPPGYVTPAPVQSALQFAFYRYPGFDSKIFSLQTSNKQTNAFGEGFTLGAAYAPATTFTGPVDIVNGQNDWFYCGGDCTYPTNQAAAAIPAYFPAASKGSQSFLVPNTGHNVNSHYAAGQAFQQMLAFLKTNGIV